MWTGPSEGKSISPRHHWTTNPVTWNTGYCRNTTKKRSEVKRSAHRVINKMAMDLETLKECGQDLQKGNPFHPDPTGLQIQWPGIQITEGRLQKSGHEPKDQLKAPSLKWPLCRKHSGMVDRTSRREIHFTQTPLDYKSSDLEYRLLQEHYKKAVRS